ncbi:MAG: YlbF family regulator [Ruminococcaceae bacterium]|nr:YlbF family regulator [Oscillospiraceae bacterium]
MTKIIEIAHMLGEEIAKSDEIKNLNRTKEAFDNDEALQNKMREYEADRLLLGQEYAKPEGEADEKAIADIKARIEALTSEISASPVYIEFSMAQKAMNDLMGSVNAEIKFCITGERPSTCTHDCSTCGGCSH